MITIIRKKGDKTLYYNNPKIIEKTEYQIIFIDSRTGEKISLPHTDYQLEERGEQ